ncbi:MAG: CoA synthetase, partial [Pseudomonadota bacterium]
NINLMGIGAYPDLKARFPGTFGSAYLYHLIPRVILFRDVHTPRTLVDRVDFVSANGVSEQGVWRGGGPHALVTGRCVFGFDRDAGRFALQSVHDGETVESVRAQTGFDYVMPDTVPETPALGPEAAELLHGQVADQVAEIYPQFADRLAGLA